MYINEIIGRVCATECGHIYIIRININTNDTPNKWCLDERETAISASFPLFAGVGAYVQSIPPPNPPSFFRRPASNAQITANTSAHLFILAHKTHNHTHIHGRSQDCFRGGVLIFLFLLLWLS